eukprot:3762417-Prymnesium_polylepis.1
MVAHVGASWCADAHPRSEDRSSAQESGHGQELHAGEGPGAHQRDRAAQRRPIGLRRQAFLYCCIRRGHSRVPRLDAAADQTALLCDGHLKGLPSTPAAAHTAAPQLQSTPAGPAAPQWCRRAIRAHGGSGTDTMYMRGGKAISHTETEIPSLCVK